MLDGAGDDTRKAREGIEVRSRLQPLLPDGLSSGTESRHSMPRLVDVLSTAGEPAGCWFHHEKAALVADDRRFQARAAATGNARLPMVDGTRAYNIISAMS